MVDSSASHDMPLMSGSGPAAEATRVGTGVGLGRCWVDVARSKPAATPHTSRIKPPRAAASGKVRVPFGVGIGQPWQVEDSAEGPFVTDGSCFYWIHTHTGDGVVHIESPVRRRFTLGDFFALWQVPLSTTQVGPGQGPVISYVNGQVTSTSPSEIPLLPHERIQLDVGTDVPPYPFDFAPGD